VRGKRISQHFGGSILVLERVVRPDPDTQRDLIEIKTSGCDIDTLA
jgi:hypothetical protein